MKTKTVDEAAKLRDQAERARKDQHFADLLYGYRAAARREIAELVTAYMGEKSIVANCQILNNTLRVTDRGIDIVPRDTPANVESTPARTAGRARQAKAMRLYWAKRRAQKGKR